MRCSVDGCTNDNGRVSKSQGITFHALPKDNNLSKLWLQALGKNDLLPKEKCVVCSEHFLSEDLYKTKKGVQKLRPGAVPHIFQGSSDIGYSKSHGYKLCRICLAVDRKVLPISKYRLEMAYEELTGLCVIEDTLPKYLCVECAQRLTNCSRFRQKSLQAYLILMEFAQSHDSEQFLTKENISLLKQKRSKIASSLETKVFVPDHTDYIFEYTTPNLFIEKTEIKIEEITEAELRIKHENEDFILNDDVNEEDNDRNYNDDYLSDDSLPLNETKIFKEKHKLSNKAEEAGANDDVEMLAVTELPNEVSLDDKEIEKASTKVKRRVGKDSRRKPAECDLSISLFTVTNLNAEEERANVEKRKESANYRNSMFKCTVCFKGFVDEDAYDSHMSRHTDVCGSFACEFCKIRFKSLKLVHKHVTAHHKQRFSCNECPYVCMNRQSARLHQKWHRGTNYKCAHCGEIFYKFSSHMSHVRIKHPSDFVCELCGYSYVSEKGKILHKRMTHRLDNTEIPPDGPMCEQCNIRFISEEALTRHFSVSAKHHVDRDQKKKSNNGKVIKKPLQKTAHKRWRRYEGPPIPCEQCGMQLGDLREYHNHFRRMHRDKNRTFFPAKKRAVMCDVCGKLFQSNAHLKDHAFSHSGEKPFKCDVCNKYFMTKAHLLIHCKQHSEVKKTFPCQQCGKHFTTYGNRTRHMVVHTELRPYKCELCEKYFKSTSEKRSHIKYVHLKKPWPKRTRGKRTDARKSPLPTEGSIERVSEKIILPISSCETELDMMEEKPMY